MKITETNFNVATGETTTNEREETPTEKKDRENELQRMASQKIAIDAAATQKAALLARLGITADEAKLLIG